MGISRQETFGHGILHALVDGGNEAARNLAAHDLIEEFVAAARIGLDAKPAIAELARAARLLLVATLRFGGLSDGLAIRHAHRHEHRLDAVLLLHASQDGIDLRIAHSGEHGLVGFLAPRDAHSRIVLRNARERRAELVLVFFDGRLDGDGILRHGQRKGIDRQIARAGKLCRRFGIGELGNHDDVARFRTFHRSIPCPS